MGNYSRNMGAQSHTLFQFLLPNEKISRSVAIGCIDLVIA